MCSSYLPVDGTLQRRSDDVATDPNGAWIHATAANEGIGEFSRWVRPSDALDDCHHPTLNVF